MKWTAKGLSLEKIQEGEGKFMHSFLFNRTLAL